MGASHSEYLEGVPAYSVGNERDYSDGDFLVFSAQGLKAIRIGLFGGRGNLQGGLDSSKLEQLGLIKREKKLGSGAFGVVYKGTLQSGQSVAIKEMNPHANVTFDDLKREGNIMTGLSHKNVVELIQVFTDTSNFVIVMEYLKNGDLLKYLRSSHVSEGQMKQFAIDIANGMAYLESRNVVHRDLAARNVLLDSTLTAKVADFGLARLLPPGQSSFATQSQCFPVLWTAPEGFRGHYSTKSDVWSYGIVLLEIVTRGVVTLYPGVADLDSYFRSGGRQKQPHNCSNALYALMKACWEYNPSSRPNFSAIAGHLYGISLEK